MEYTEEVLDRQTGDLTTRSLGQWLTITELGREYGEGQRRTRTILAGMEAVVPETHGGRSRYRVARWMTACGWAKRHRSREGFPFDVVGPEAQGWIAARWPEAKAKAEDRLAPAHVRGAKGALECFESELRGQTMETRLRVAWLQDHFPDLSESEVAAITDVSQQRVHTFASQRERQRRRAEVWKAASPDAAANLKRPLIGQLRRNPE